MLLLPYFYRFKIQRKGIILLDKSAKSFPLLPKIVFHESGTSRRAKVTCDGKMLKVLKILTELKTGAMHKTIHSINNQIQQVWS
jgi:hypothetical protein